MAIIGRGKLGGAVVISEWFYSQSLHTRGLIIEERINNKDIDESEKAVLRHYMGSKDYKLWITGMEKLKSRGVDKTLERLEVSISTEYTDNIYNILLEYYLNPEIKDTRPPLTLRERKPKLSNLKQVIQDMDDFIDFLGMSPPSTSLSPPPLIFGDGKGDIQLIDDPDSVHWLDAIKANLERLEKELEKNGFNKKSVGGRPASIKLAVTAISLSEIFRHCTGTPHWKWVADILSPLTDEGMSEHDISSKVQKFARWYKKNKKSLSRTQAWISRP